MCLSRIKKFFTQSKTPAAPVLNGRKILAIDDETTQRTMIQSTLEKKGYSVLLAENGRQGLDVAFDQKPDLILLDVMMPEMNGEEVCKRLKNDSRTKDIPVLFLTSMDTPKDVIKHYEIGGEVHLTKPINPKELISQIEMTFGSK